MVTPSLGRRFGALFVDWMIASFSAAALTRSAVYGEHAVAAWVPVVVFWVEVSLLTGLLGYSIGKRLFGLRVINPAGRPPGLWRAMVRTALVSLVVPTFIVTQDEDRRGLQDVLAGTKQVRA